MTHRNKPLQLFNPFLFSFLLLIAVFLSTGAAWGQVTLTAAAFGMQCGQGTTNGVNSYCKYGQQQANKIVLPTEPGTLRLWDSEVEWSALNPSCSTPPCTNWNWDVLDPYLDAIAAASNVTNVIYTFGWVPCWDASSCSDPTNNRTDMWPSDLGAQGSATFSAFVTALVQHCSTDTGVMNCVGKCPKNDTCNKSNLIQSYEMWNEADNSSVYWAGTAQQLYEMVKPAVTIIKNNVTGAQILTPSVDANGEGWMLNNWLPQETQNTIISTVYNFHIYLEQSSPEEQYYCAVVIDTLSACPTGTPAHGLLYPNFYGPSGWKALPWIVSETNFQDATAGASQEYKCDSSNFTAADCAGQIVRWQALLNSNVANVGTGESSNGASNLSWYNWAYTIGDYSTGTANTNPTDYYYMQQYMIGGHFTTVCLDTSNGTGTIAVACPFLQKGQTKNGLWLWTDSESGGLTYTIPANTYKDYLDVSDGMTHTITSTQTTVPIGVAPILLEPKS